MDRTDWREKVEAIARNPEKGASELAREALGLIAEACQETPPAHQGVAQVQALARTLSECRPAMAPLRNLALRWLSRMEASEGPPEAWLAKGQAQAQAMAAASLEAVSQIARQALLQLPPRCTLMTHSRSSTIRTLAQAGAKRGRRFHWLVTRSEPDHEGLRLARELAELGHSVAVLTEAQIPLVLAEVDVVVVGADTVLANGNLVNKAGTHLMALAAAAARRPLLCLCESFKFSDQTQFEPEPHGLEALQLPDHPAITGFNFTFDQTPPHLVSAWLTESGLTVNPSATIALH